MKLTKINESRQFNSEIDLKLIHTIKITLLTYTFFVLTACNDNGSTSSLTNPTDPIKSATIQSYQDNVGNIQNDSSTAAITDDNTPTLNIAKSLSNVKLYLDSQLIESTYDDQENKNLQ